MRLILLPPTAGRKCSTENQTSPSRGSSRIGQHGPTANLFVAVLESRHLSRRFALRILTGYRIRQIESRQVFSVVFDSVFSFFSGSPFSIPLFCVPIKSATTKGKIPAVSELKSLNGSTSRFANSSVFTQRHWRLLVVTQLHWCSLRLIHQNSEYFLTVAKTDAKTGRSRLNRRIKIPHRHRRRGEDVQVAWPAI